MGGQHSKRSKFDELEDSRDAMTRRDRNRMAATGGDAKEPQYIPRREATKEQIMSNEANGNRSQNPPIQSTESSDDANDNRTSPKP
jgi:hypothetical protein